MPARDTWRVTRSISRSATVSLRTCSDLPRRHRPILKAYPPNTVFLSRTHAANHHSEIYVYNGIPIDEYPLKKTKDLFMLFMAKLAWRVKNAKTAFHLSFDSGLPLKIAGGDLWGTPRLWGGWTLRAPFYRGLLTDVGNVGGVAKRKLLQDFG